MGPENHLRVSIPDECQRLIGKLHPYLRGLNLELTLQGSSPDDAFFDLQVVLDPPTERTFEAPEFMMVLLSKWSDEQALSWLRRGVFNCVSVEDVKGMALSLAQASQLNQLLKMGRLLPQIINAIPAPIFYKDTEGRYMGANTAFSEYIGIATDELIGKNVFDIAPLELAQVYHEADKALMAKGATQRYNAKVKFADGSLRHIDFHKAVFECPVGVKAGQVGVMLDITKHIELEEKLKAQALTDPLTGAHNRRSFMSLANSALEQSRRTGRPLSLLVLDLDHFKTINDRFSHAAGDKILMSVVTRCQECLRSYDVLCRGGGEEFFVLLPDTDTHHAITIAERIRQTISTLSIGQGDGIFRVTTSIGIAEFSPADLDINALLHRADTALYAAKGEGRNRVEVAQPRVVQPGEKVPTYQRRGEPSEGS